MERDLNTGRFLKGNKIALGNRGNRSSKWGNRNAIKHGLYSRNFNLVKVQEDGDLLIQNISVGCLVNPEYFYKEEDGSIMIHKDIIGRLRDMGIVLSISN